MMTCPRSLARLAEAEHVAPEPTHARNATIPQVPLLSTAMIFVERHAPRQACPWRTWRRSVLRHPFRGTTVSGGYA